MYSDTVTIFNKYEESDGAISWFPKVISGADLNIDKAANVAKTGLEAADAAKLHIKYTKTGDVIYIAGIQYMPPIKWAAQDDHEGTITLNTGDIFILGEYEDTDEISDADYTTRVNGGFYDYLNKTADAVFLITTVSGAFSLIPHFEIGGK